MRTRPAHHALTLTLTLFAFPVSAQVLTIADTIGKGKNAILVSDNQIFVDEFRLNIAYGQWVRGLGNRFDLYAAAGETTTEGLTQAWVGGGGNLALFKAGRVSVSAFNVATVPVTRRDQACQVLLNSALVTSVPLGSRVFVYSGVNGLIPIGDRARGVFTPPDTKFNVPLGATVAFGPWGLWGEFDAGPLHAVGVGLTRIF
jgi:hypothetical protein